MTESAGNHVLPAAWRHVSTISVGGLTEIGFCPGEDYLLVVSFAGRSLIDMETGERVARDHQEPTAISPWTDEVARTVEAIGPLQGTQIPCFGVWGGTLPARIPEWRLNLAQKGTQETISLIDEATGIAWLLTRSVTEIRAFGFSETGRILAIATASDVALFRSV